MNNYRRATELKPSENVFWDPKNRAELLLWQASGLVAQVEAFEEAKKISSKPAATVPDQVAAGKTDLFRQVRSRMQPAPAVTTNNTVVQLVKTGHTADYITAYIKHAQGTQFDLSPAEVLKLRRDGVSNGVLKTMAESQRGPRYSFGLRTKAVIAVVSLLWWLPLVLAR